MKKVALVLVLSLIGGLCFGSGEPESTPDEGSLKVGMVVDIGGLGDQAFNDAAYRGLQRAEEQLGAEIRVVESSTVADYETNMRTLSRLGYDLVIAVGNMLTDATVAVAPEFVDTEYLLIDGKIGDMPNLLSIEYNEEEAAFLAGALAAKMSETKQIGFVLGMRIPILEKFEFGYLAGAKTANPDVEVFISYTGRFDDPGLGKETALTQFGAGADVVASAAGACNLGVFEAATQMGPGYWAMGAAAGQSHLAPEDIMADQVKRLDNTIFYVTEQYAAGNFQPGLEVFGLEQGGVGLLYGEDPANIPQDVYDYIDMLTQMVVAGEIDIPISAEEFESFEPPVI